MLNIDQMVEDLANNGWSCQEKVFENNFIDNILENFKEKSLKEAGIGSGKQCHKEIRNDSISWIERDTKSLSEKSYFNFLDEVKEKLNLNLYLGIRGSEVHYAKYSSGGFYKPHMDNLHGKNNRIITLITYLNKEWVESDGGKLILHLDNGKKDIKPVAGTVVAFLSDRILHEVSESYKVRESLTGWLLKDSI